MFLSAGTHAHTRGEHLTIRRFTLDVLEVPYLRSSIPHPKPDFSRTQIASRRTIPRPKYTKRSFFETELGFRRHSDHFWSRSPVIQNLFSLTVLPLRAATYMEGNVLGAAPYKNPVAVDITVLYGMGNMKGLELRLMLARLYRGWSPSPWSSVTAIP